MEKLKVVGPYLLGHVPGNLVALVALVLVFGCFALLGRMLLRRWHPTAPLVGWAIAYVAALVLALAGARSLAPVAALVAAGALASAARHRRELADVARRTAPYLVLALPLAGTALFMPLLHWDSYWHWVPNASWLERFDRLPALPLDGLPSFHPTYPVALPLVHYLAGLVGGRLEEAAGPVLHVVLTVLAAAAIAPLLRDALAGTAYGRAPAFARWGVPSLALALVLPLNPAFRIANYWSALADPALGFVVLLAVLHAGAFLARPARSAGDRDDLVALAALGVLVSGTKHSGWVLALVLVAAFGALALAQRLPWRRPAAAGASVLGGAVLAHALWSAWLASRLPIAGQFHVRPLAEWRFDLAPALAHGILREILASPGYYGLVVAGTLAGLWLLRTRPLAPWRLALACAALALPVHFASLVAAYLGTGFFVPEIARAASLQRYSAQVGHTVATLALVGAVALAARTFAARALARDGRSAHERPAAPGTGRTATAVVVAAGTLALLVLVAVPSLRYAAFFMNRFQTLRDDAARVVHALPRGDSFTVLGDEWAVNFAGYESWRPERDSRALVFAGRKIVESAADLPAAIPLVRAWQADPAVDHVWIVDAGVLADALALPRARNLVWSRASGTWRVLDAQPDAPRSRIAGR